MEQKAQSLHFLQISHRTDLASKDMGILKDAMDIRGVPSSNMGFHLVQPQARYGIHGCGQKLGMLVKKA